jgi:hypothetical protein
LVDSGQRTGNYPGSFGDNDVPAAEEDNDFYLFCERRKARRPFYREASERLT